MKQLSFAKGLMVAAAVSLLAFVVLMSCGGEKAEEGGVVAGPVQQRHQHGEPVQQRAREHPLGQGQLLVLVVR